METHWRWMAKATCRARRLLAREDGQGPKDSASLVGVTVVTAIIAITAFLPKLHEPRDSIPYGAHAP